MSLFSIFSVKQKPKKERPSYYIVPKEEMEIKDDKDDSFKEKE